MTSHLARAAVLAAIALIAAGAHAQVAPYDLLIRNARVVDGAGGPWFRADVAVRGDTIVAVARGIEGAATRTIDAREMILAPGFIDLHVHALGPVNAAPAVFPIEEVPTADNYVRQGVTTLVSGPDGFSPVPLGPALERLRTTRITPNLAAFIGHGSIRSAVLGDANRAPTAPELDRMRELVRAGMRDGAFGLSTGLFYLPAGYATTEELIELGKAAGALGGIHISHMRDETGGVLDSVRDTIRVGEEGGLPTQITHHKTVGKPMWGRTVDSLRLVDEARARGVDVTLDTYPYTASATLIQSALLPTWAQEGTQAEILARLRDPATRRRLIADTSRIILEERGGGDPHNVQLASCTWDTSLDGMRLDEVVKRRGLAPTVENAAETTLWLIEQGGCGGIYHAIDEDDVQRVLRHPTTMIASDGAVVMFGRANPHPRSYGTFVRVLGRYVRDLNVLTLEDAVRRMTSFPAQRIGLADRGLIRTGMKADLVAFNPQTIRDTATFERPHQYPEGVDLVVINGVVAFEQGRMTPARPGRVLYGPARTVGN